VTDDRQTDRRQTTLRRSVYIGGIGCAARGIPPKNDKMRKSTLKTQGTVRISRWAVFGITYRELIDRLMSSTGRKLCFDGQELVQALVMHFQYDHKHGSCIIP